MKPRDRSLSGTSGALRAETEFIRAVYSKSWRACTKASSNRHYSASLSIPNIKHMRAILGNSHRLHLPFGRQPPCSSVLPAYNSASPEARCRSGPTPRADFRLRAPVAQWIEHLPPKKGVTRSIRVGGAKHFHPSLPPVIFWRCPSGADFQPIALRDARFREGIGVRWTRYLSAAFTFANSLGVTLA